MIKICDHDATHDNGPLMRQMPGFTDGSNAGRWKKNAFEDKMKMMVPLKSETFILQLLPSRECKLECTSRVGGWLHIQLECEVYCTSSVLGLSHIESARLIAHSGCEVDRIFWVRGWLHILIERFMHILFVRFIARPECEVDCTS